MSSVPSVRVLVVDDDASIRLLVTRTLEKQGFMVDSAVDGVEALQKLSECGYDLLVLDLMMPRLGGVGVIEELPANGPAPKILVMTAASPSVLHQIPRDRVDAIITKPFDLTTLVAAAEKLSDAKDEKVL
jgi:CheY-like chemotaxis protein